MGPAYRIIEVLPNQLTPDSNRPLLIAGFRLVVATRQFRLWQHFAAGVGSVLVEVAALDR
jgi:hypothetical protein